MNVFDTVSRAYHQKIAKDRANKEGIVVNPPSLGNRPGEGKVTYSSEVNEVLIPYTTREDTYNYYEVRNYVNDVNQENTQVLQTYDDEMKARETYTYGNERLSYTNEKTKDEYQYLTDARGSVTGMMQDGELSSPNSYSVFGTPEEVDETGNPYGYTGEAQDVTGYNYLRARYYDSQSGTFLTQDSYEGEEDNPLSQNGYTYVENNPINYADPTGHKKNFFQNLWNKGKKVVNKYIVKPVVKAAKWVGNKVSSAAKWVGNKVSSAAKWVGNKVQGVVRAAGNIWNGVTNFAKTSYNRVVNTFTGGGSTGAGRGIAGPPYPGGYWNANRAPSSQSYMSHEQLVAIQTAQRQQQLTQAYQKATGSKGTPKTKEALNMLKNWGKAMEKTWTKFCKTAPKVVKNIAKTGVAFSAGFVKQTLSNNGIVLPINSRLAMWLDQDWIKKNPAYNKGVFIGQLSGLAQAASEYIAAGLTFTAGTLGSGFADLFVAVGSGGTAAPAMPALIATEMALVTAATAAIGKHAGTVMQNSLKGNNYSSSGNNRGPTEKFEKEISRLSPNERVAKVTEKARELAKKNGWKQNKDMMKKNKGRTIYTDGKGNNYSVDTQHGRLEKLNDRGRHQGEFDFDLNQTKPADKSGGHDLNVK